MVWAFFKLTLPDGEFDLFAATIMAKADRSTFKGTPMEPLSLKDKVTLVTGGAAVSDALLWKHLPSGDSRG
jgi:hypothetical protein